MPEIDLFSVTRMPGLLRPIIVLCLFISIICLATVGNAPNNAQQAGVGFMLFVMITCIVKVFFQILINLFQYWPFEESNIVNFVEWIFDLLYALLHFICIWISLAYWIQISSHAAAFGFSTFMCVGVSACLAFHGYFFYLVWKNPATTTVTPTPTA